MVGLGWTSLSFMLPYIITVLGPDRVGKSTLVNNLKSTAIASNKFESVDCLHFSGPKPYHNDPIQQYLIPFNSYLKKTIDTNSVSDNLLLCDRGFSEVCFYDSFRRNIDINDEWAMSAESYFYENCKDIEVFLISRDWDWCLPHHEKEILEQHKHEWISLWHMNNLLSVRKKEHKAYYDYMLNYLFNKSLLKNKVKIIDNTDYVNLKSSIPNISLKS